nr:FAR1 DNA binding domain, zinc finger, SWIM-type, MULE transposase domain, FHY3/FAR1 family [Tanacetum cinerariifolium]
MTLKGYIGYCKNDPLGLQDYEVVLNKIDCSVTCSCGHYNQHGFLCRYVFCVFRIYGIHKIPDAYLKHRWTKNVLPTYLLDKMHRYAPCMEETDTLASQVEGGGNVAVDDEDEGDTDDQFDDEALGATKDEFDKDDEIDDEFSSDEE